MAEKQSKPKKRSARKKSTAKKQESIMEQNNPTERPTNEGVTGDDSVSDLDAQLNELDESNTSPDTGDELGPQEGDDGQGVGTASGAPDLGDGEVLDQAPASQDGQQPGDESKETEEASNETTEDQSAPVSTPTEEEAPATAAETEDVAIPDEYFLIDARPGNSKLLAEALYDLDTNRVYGEEVVRARRKMYNGILIGLTLDDPKDTKAFLDKLLPFIAERKDTIFEAREMARYVTESKRMTNDQISQYVTLTRALVGMADEKNRDRVKAAIRWNSVFKTFTGPHADEMASRLAGYFKVSRV